MTYEIDSACAIKSGVDRYTYRAEWLPDYGEYVGVCRIALSEARSADGARGRRGH
jgi:hypothetical protein